MNRSDRTEPIYLAPISRHLSCSKEFRAFSNNPFRLDGFQVTRNPQKVFGKALRRGQCDRQPERKDDPICRDRDDSSLGKAIKKEQRADEIGASAMWRPCFGCRFASREDTRKRKRRKRRRREDERNAFINTAGSKSSMRWI